MAIYNTGTGIPYAAGTGLSKSGTTFSVKLGYTTSGNNRAVQVDSNGNLYVAQTDTWKANSSSSEGYVASGNGQVNKIWKTNASGEPAWRDALAEMINYTTTVPTAANTNGLKVVLCDSEPETKYDGWIYLIKES